jgi:transposase
LFLRPPQFAENYGLRIPEALAGLPVIFGNSREQVRQQSDAEKDELYKQIGQLKVELDFLKKRAGLID